uniref:Peptidase A2A retrovirus catalytic n=1 Tax=Cyanothece sp. (strain PCC 7425 / ATCC 29141) TaxID=395961 RepID=B8HL73_CYAP4
MVSRGLALFTTLSLLLTPLPGISQTNLGSLNNRLQQAVNQQNWKLAIEVIDQMIIAAPQQAADLRAYRQQLVKLNQAGVRVPATSSTAPSRPTSGLAGSATVKRRLNGIPVVEVRFNDRLPYEMLVDSGASMTVITRPMARALGITPADVVDRAVFSTANGTIVMPIVYINSIEVAGLTKTRIPVAVGGPELDMGLLGQDFLHRFDVSFRQQVIEFHQRP